MDHSMVNVEVASVMRIDDLWLDAGHQILHQLYDLQQRYRIEAIVRQLVQENILHPNFVCRRMRLPLQSGQLIRIRGISLQVSRGYALSHNCEANLAALLHETGSRSAAAKNL